MAEHRSTKPTHWLTQTRDYGDGHPARHTMASHYLTAVEAQQARVARLRDARIPYQAGPGWVTYREDQTGVHPELRCDVRLEWTDHDSEAGR